MLGSAVRSGCRSRVSEHLHGPALARRRARLLDRAAAVDRVGRPPGMELGGGDHVRDNGDRPDRAGNTAAHDAVARTDRGDLGRVHRPDARLRTERIDRRPTGGAPGTGSTSPTPTPKPGQRVVVADPRSSQALPTPTPIPNPRAGWIVAVANTDTHRNPVAGPNPSADAGSNPDADTHAYPATPMCPPW